MEDRVKRWTELTGNPIHVHLVDLAQFDFLREVFLQRQPEAFVHFAEPRSAPYSMIDREHAVFKHTNNVVGTLNVLYALKDLAPFCLLVKLGTMANMVHRILISRKGI